ncbi:hypothetical protein MMPV_000684 [Pyropia vietnamensis]
MPKAVLPVANVPLLAYPLRLLLSAGVRAITVVAAPGEGLAAIWGAITAVVKDPAIEKSMQGNRPTIDMVAVAAAGTVDAVRAVVMAGNHGGDGDDDSKGGRGNGGGGDSGATFEGITLVVAADLFADRVDGVVALLRAHVAGGTDLTALYYERGGGGGADTAGLGAAGRGGGGGGGGGGGKKTKGSGGGGSAPPPAPLGDEFVVIAADGPPRPPPWTAPLVYVGSSTDGDADGLLRVPPRVLATVAASNGGSNGSGGVTLRRDLSDAHLYALSPALVARLATARPGTSVKYDFLRWVTGAAAAEAGITAAAVAASGVGVRVNNLAAYTAFNKLLSGGAGGAWLRLYPPPETLLPWVRGERFHVGDSLLAMWVTVGDRGSVKKSVLGEGVAVGEGSKVASSVLMQGVRVGVVDDAADDAADGNADADNGDHGGAHLTGCLVGADAVIGRGVVLKDCVVAPGVTVLDSGTGEVYDGRGAGGGLLDDDFL